MLRLNLDQLDYKILTNLTKNARKPFLEIARESNVSGAAIHQRVAKLQNIGVVTGSELLVNPALVGFETCAFMGFFLKDPASYNEIVDKLREIPEVVECYFTTGEYDMLIKLYARNNDHLLQLIHGPLQSLGLSRTETLIVFSEVFNRPLPIEVNHPMFKK
ncbi:MAG: Lrp/AsnC ligand binding domain-containing protein [Muribaculaceae bacterium]|nr:Lrp/AsnC ligand binding domain-containing protein [Muribaculaceae bacterium]MDE5967529.1 Lrp/AsnC ligand binding domain-containing protein [Muribaculaceae bacterium]